MGSVIEGICCDEGIGNGFGVFEFAFEIYYDRGWAMEKP